MAELDVHVESTVKEQIAAVLSSTATELDLPPPTSAQLKVVLQRLVQAYPPPRRTKTLNTEYLSVYSLAEARELLHSIATLLRRLMAQSRIPDVCGWDGLLESAWTAWRVFANSGDETPKLSLRRFQEWLSQVAEQKFVAQAVDSLLPALERLASRSGFDLVASRQRAACVLWQLWRLARHRGAATDQHSLALWIDGLQVSPDAADGRTIAGSYVLAAAAYAEIEPAIVLVDKIIRKISTTWKRGSARREELGFYDIIKLNPVNELSRYRGDAPLDAYLRSIVSRTPDGFGTGHVQLDDRQVADAPPR
jgi:hypothetical protein